MITGQSPQGEEAKAEDDVSKNDDSPRNEMNTEDLAQHVVRINHLQIAATREMGKDTQVPRQSRKKGLANPGCRQGHKRNLTGGITGAQ